MDNVEEFLKKIDNCFLPKLARNYDEIDDHAEYETRNKNLDDNINELVKSFEDVDIKKSDKEITILSCLIKLCKELQVGCSWNDPVKGKVLAKKISEQFELKFNMKLEEILKKNEMFDSQLVYDHILDDLCKKLTYENFKRFPGQLEVYCTLVQKFRDYDVAVYPMKILPVALILMDDYIPDNKAQGLMCCLGILKYLTPQEFEGGNYYDVIYYGVKKAITIKELNVTELSQSCNLELIQIFPAKERDKRLDEMYSDALDQLNTETDFTRKTATFKYMKTIMQKLRIRCVAKSLFKTVLCDTLEYCIYKNANEVLALAALECLEEWIKHCWPIWSLGMDYMILCALLKYFCSINCTDNGIFVKKLIVSLVCLCTTEEQKQIVERLRAADEEENSNVKMEELKNDINT